VRALLPLAALALIAPGDAAAYIDPGTGSLILQGLIATLAAAAMVVRGYWYRIKAFFRGDKAAPNADAKPDAQPKPPGEPE
jgi:hypothetical protein